VFGAVQLRGKVTAVVGMRRAGKTMFLHQIQRERLQGGVSRERMPYINFEDERLVGLTAEHLHPLVEEYYRRFPALRGHQRVIWCFDEIQAVPGWERFIRRLLDSVNPRKAYPVDPGLIPIFDRTGRSNTGHALETAVLIELERRRAEVSYVKTALGYEVDFLARYPSGQTELIQVCANAGASDTAERELRSLMEAGRMFPRAQKRILTLTQDGLPRAVPADVLAQPAYVWALMAPDAA